MVLLAPKSMSLFGALLVFVQLSWFVYSEDSGNPNDQASKYFHSKPATDDHGEIYSIFYLKWPDKSYCELPWSDEKGKLTWDDTSTASNADDVTCDDYFVPEKGRKCRGTMSTGMAPEIFHTSYYRILRDKSKGIMNEYNTFDGVYYLQVRDVCSQNYHSDSSRMGIQTR